MKEKKKKMKFRANASGDELLEFLTVVYKLKPFQFNGMLTEMGVERVGEEGAPRPLEAIVSDMIDVYVAAPKSTRKHLYQLAAETAEQNIVDRANGKVGIDDVLEEAAEKWREKHSLDGSEVRGNGNGAEESDISPLRDLSE